MNNKYIKKIKLDFNPAADVQIIDVKQNDFNGRLIEITLYEHGRVRTVSNDSLVYLRGAKKDIVNLYNTCSVDNGKIIIEMTENMIATTDAITADIVICEGNGILSTAKFVLRIEDVPYDIDSAKSTSEYKALEVLIAKTGEMLEESGKHLVSEFNIIDSDLVVTYLDGSQKNLGHVVGKQGPAGEYKENWELVYEHTFAKDTGYSNKETLHLKNGDFDLLTLPLILSKPCKELIIRMLVVYSDGLRESYFSIANSPEIGVHMWVSSGLIGTYCIPSRNKWTASLYENNCEILENISLQRSRQYECLGSVFLDLFDPEDDVMDCIFTDVLSMHTISHSSGDFKDLCYVFEDESVLIGSGSVIKIWGRN